MPTNEPDDQWPAVAGRPDQCRPRAALPPPSEAPGPQHVRPVLAGPLRQQPDPQLARQRRRLRERQPPALGGQQLTSSPRGRGPHRDRGPGRRLVLPPVQPAPALLAPASSSSSSPPRRRRLLGLGRRVPQHRGGAQTPTPGWPQDPGPGRRGGDHLAAQPRASARTVTNTAAAATNQRGWLGLWAVHQDGAQAGGQAGQPRLAPQDAQVLSSI